MIHFEVLYTEPEEGGRYKASLTGKEIDRRLKGTDFEGAMISLRKFDPLFHMDTCMLIIRVLSQGLSLSEEGKLQELLGDLAPVELVQATFYEKMEPEPAVALEGAQEA